MNPAIPSWAAQIGLRGLCFAALLVLPAVTQAQTPRDSRAQELFQSALEARSARLASVDDYTMVRSINGAELTVYFEKRVIEDYPIMVEIPPYEYENQEIRESGLGDYFGGQGTPTSVAANGPASGTTAGISHLSDDLPKLPHGLPALPRELPQLPGLGKTAGSVFGQFMNASAGGGSVASTGPGQGISGAGMPGMPGGRMPGATSRTASSGGGASVTPAIPKAGMPSMPGAGGAAAGAALGAISGGLQNQLMQRGMEGLMGGGGEASAEAGAENAAIEVRMYEELGRRARLTGTETVDGEETYVLVADDLDGLDLGPSNGDDEVHLRSLTVWLDSDDYVPRRSMIETDVEAPAGPQTVKIEILDQDYHRVEGLYEPFRRVIRVSGMMEAMRAANPEEMEKADREMKKAMAQMDEVRKRIADLPPEQRRMIEAQMGPAVEKAKQQMAEFGSGTMELVTEVEELRVNEGPPRRFGSGTIAAAGDVEMTVEGMVVMIGPAFDAAGAPAGSAVQLLGGIEDTATVLVQIHVPAGVDETGSPAATGVAVFRWSDGTGGSFETEPGEARLEITAHSKTRISGTFELDANGALDSEGSTPARVRVTGSFEAPPPANLPGLLPSSIAAP